MDQSPPNILLVEDNEDHAALFQRAMRGESVDITWVPSGEDALVRLSEERFELLILDLNMPGIDGFEVLSQVRANDSTRCLPTVVLSTSAAPDDTQQAYELAANSYVVKPVEWDEFRALAADLAHYWLRVNRPASH